MAYKVIKDFKDLQDENYIYRAGDKYPRKGRGKKERIEELSGSDNLRGEPLIVEEEGDS
ncbi:hypothetical protein M3231_11890 [Neobacillus mesonae]|nr:hypothetical protein [Neobacillus mesonae]